jgi:hypothetical protein
MRDHLRHILQPLVNHARWRVLELLKQRLHLGGRHAHLVLIRLSLLRQHFRDGCTSIKLALKSRLVSPMSVPPAPAAADFTFIFDSGEGLIVNPTIQHYQPLYIR